MKSLMNWKQRIDRAMKSGRFTNEDKMLAEEWTTCAVGEFTRRQGRGMPTDADLTLAFTKRSVYTLGFMFYDAVQCNCPSWALKLYKKIQARLTRRTRCNTL